MKMLKKLTAVLLLSCFAMPALAGGGKVNINKADANTLMKELEGVDQTLANSIVSAREQEGVFIAPYDLSYVEGVDRSFFKKNYGRITVGDVNLDDKKQNPFT